MVCEDKHKHVNEREKQQRTGNKDDDKLEPDKNNTDATAEDDPEKEFDNMLPGFYDDE